MHSQSLALCPGIKIQACQTNVYLLRALTKLGTANRVYAGVGLIINERPIRTLAAVHHTDSNTDDDGVGISAT